MSKVFIVLNVRDDAESKYPSIVFLSIYNEPGPLYQTHIQMEEFIHTQRVIYSAEDV